MIQMLKWKELTRETKHKVFWLWIAQQMESIFIIALMCSGAYFFFLRITDRISFEKVIFIFLLLIVGCLLGLLENKQIGKQVPKIFSAVENDVNKYYKEKLADLEKQRKELDDN